MFTKAEIDVIGKTLMQRREWLAKAINNPDMATAKIQNQQTQEVIESALAKLAQLNKSLPANTETSKAVKPPSVHKRAHMQPSDIRVLVVDDDPFLSEVMSALLKSTGIKKVDVADDGLKGISMLYDANPVYNLVLCDWHMPIKTGLDVHNAMRAAERYVDTCFILVTAVTEAKQIRSAIEEGVDDYIVKPIEEQTTLKKLARHFPTLYNPENTEDKQDAP